MAATAAATPVGAAQEATASASPLPAKYTARGVCNRMIAAGAAKECMPSDSGTQVQFWVSGHDCGGLVDVMTNDQYSRVMNGMNFTGWTVASSEEQHVLVMWRGPACSELAGLQIRAAVAAL